MPITDTKDNAGNWYNVGLFESGKHVDIQKAWLDRMCAFNQIWVLRHEEIVKSRKCENQKKIGNLMPKEILLLDVLKANPLEITAN